ncbi:esterase [Chromatiales bacterium (ex Bugula neritina AB1)]|nr:esterase [Chromatiales bacterium (ex Bugula neritina AB1)]
MPEYYKEFIDAETWAFIELTDRWYPPETIDSTIAHQRQIYNAMCRQFHQGYPDGIEAVDHAVPVATGSHTIALRHYTKESSSAAAVVVYLHGGGFVVGGLSSHDDICSEICDNSGFDVYSVDYRLAPDHVHPAAFDDALAITRHVARERAMPIILCGDSAGGNLAAAVAHHTRGQNLDIAGQVLIYPGLGGDTSRGSYIQHAQAPMLTTRDVEFYASVRTGGSVITGDPTFAPLHDTDFSSLPPSVIISAECDPLADDGKNYSEAILSAGGKSVWVSETGLVHGYLRARSMVARARQSFERILQAITMLGNRQWHF